MPRKNKKKKRINQPPMAMGPEWVTKQSGAGFHKLKNDKRAKEKDRKNFEEWFE